MKRRRPQGVSHMHFEWVVIRYSPNAPDFAVYMARVIGRGSIQGLPRSPQSLVIRMPTATPHLLVRVRGGLTIGYLGEVAKPT